MLLFVMGRKGSGFRVQGSGESNPESPISNQQVLHPSSFILHPSSSPQLALPPDVRLHRPGGVGQGAGRDVAAAGAMGLYLLWPTAGGTCSVGLADAALDGARGHGGRRLAVVRGGGPGDRLGVAAEVPLGIQSSPIPAADPNPRRRELSPPRRGRAGDFLYYFYQIPAVLFGFFPWSVFLGPALVDTIRRIRGKEDGEVRGQG